MESELLTLCAKLTGLTSAGIFAGAHDPKRIIYQQLDSASLT